MKRILFVDDEERILDGLRRSLRSLREEWEMAFASSGDDAIGQLEEGDFDIIVTDMRMPGMDGAAVLEQVQKKHPGTVRIVLSGQAEEEAAMRAVPVTHQFLAKPCESTQLKRVVNRACELEGVLADEQLRATISEIDHLPTIPRTFAELNRVLADPESSFRDVAAVVARDTAMSAKVLQIVNSAFFGLAAEVTGLEQAVSMLGVSLIRDLALSTEVFRPLAEVKDLPGFAPDEEQQHTLLVAEMARRILKEEGDKKKVEDAFLAGLLHDIGKLLLAWKQPDRYRSVVEDSVQTGRPRFQVEREQLGVTHGEVGAYLLGIWGLPYSVLEAVAHHHEPGRLGEPTLDIAAAVHIADALVSCCWSEKAGERRGAAEGPDTAFVEAIGATERLSEWQQQADELVEHALSESRGDEEEGSDVIG